MSRECQSTLISTPNERVFSGVLFKSMPMVNNTSALLAVLAIRAFVGRNAPLVQSLVGRFFVCLTMFESLVNLESLVGDVHLEMRMSHLVGAQSMLGWIILSMTITVNAQRALKKESLAT